MKNKLWLLPTFIISMVVLSSLTSAFCVITFYTIDDSNNFIKSDLIQGYCKNAGKVNLIKYQAGGAYSWGNVFDSCEKVCGIIKINASIYDSNKLIMFGEKELNNKNVIGWNDSTTKFFNLTLNYVDDAARNSGGGSSRIVQLTQNNPTGVQTTGTSNTTSSIIEAKKEASKHLNNPDTSNEQSIIKDWMIYGFIGFILCMVIVAFLFFKNKKMGGKI